MHACLLLVAYMYLPMYNRILRIWLMSVEHPDRTEQNIVAMVSICVAMQLKLCTDALHHILCTQEICIHRR